MVPSANGAALDEANRFLFVIEEIVVPPQTATPVIDNASVAVPLQILRKFLSAIFSGHAVQRHDSQIAERAFAGREVAARISATLKTPL
jgi:hypothetical protein